MIMRQDTTPDAQFIKDFYQQDPSVGGEPVVEHWEKLVHEASERALTEFWPSLLKQKKLGLIFKFTDLAKAATAPKPASKTARRAKAGAKSTTRAKRKPA
ncbi:MAG: hypothetical protein ACI8T1_002476 [Verrucomicrobiales bacterium]|jgi:hypothetical protein